MMMTEIATKIDIASVRSLPDDEVVQLREWGTDNIHLLPRFPSGRWTVGASPTCSLRLVDRWRSISRLHAELVRDKGNWLLRDLRSTNGISLHGVRTSEILLTPGDEITIGYLTLIAEGRRTIELRAYLSRLLGWDRRLIEVVDLALRSIRLAKIGSNALVLCGDDDLVPIARSLHRRLLGDHRPFIVCDAARCQVNALRTSPENYDQGMVALAAAAAGTLCVRHERLPVDFPIVAATLRQPRTRVQLMVCARSTRYTARYQSLPITVPPIGDRAHELEWLIEEYAHDAFVQLGVETPPCLPPEDHEWVRRHAASSIAGIEKATLRLAAIRISEDVSAAAARLDMAPESLARWIERRKVPMGVQRSGGEGERPTAVRTQR